MKQSQYDVIFLTGIVETVFANSFKEAIILAMAEQINAGNQYAVEKVINKDTGEIYLQSMDRN